MKWSCIFFAVTTLLCVAVDSEAPECQGKNCRTSFSCKEVRACDCTTISGHYEIRCHSRESFILTEIRPYGYIRIDCNENASPSVYDFLKGLTVGPVDEVDFRLCPLPETSLLELLSSFGVTSFTTLQFKSHRNLTIFDGSYIRGLGNVTKLLLTSNNVSHFADGFLSEFPQLTSLDLRENNLKNLQEDFFQPVPNLEVLELGKNKLDEVSSSLFSNLKKLRLLNLWKNMLKNLTRSSFSGLTGLKQLDLSSNLMNYMSGDLFRDLVALSHINLSSNNYTSLPEGIFSTNRNLEIIRFHDNSQALSLPNGAFANLTKLKEVNLMRNIFATLPENIFWGSDAISRIDLHGNGLVQLPSRLFRDQKSLQTLDLSHNLLENLPENIFRRLNALETLNLNYNRIKKISREVFYGTHSLVTLRIKHNQLSFIDSESMTHLRGLKTADFSHNKLSFLPEESNTEFNFHYNDEFGSRSPFRSCVYLEDLDLSNNSITDMFSDWQLSLIKLKNLNLTYNKIKGLYSSEINFLSDKVIVDLRWNQISTINLLGLELLTLFQDGDSEDIQGKNVRILLENNPLNCNCQAYEFFRYLEHKFDPATYMLVTLEPGDLKCRSPPELAGLRVEEVNSSELSCPLDQNYNCPRGCNCSLRRHDSSLVVNCTRSDLTEIPGTLPTVVGTNHTELLLDGNRIGRLPNSTYPGYEMVTHLHLSQNNISDIGTGMLSRKLQVLKLDDNNLTSLSSNFVRFLSGSHGIRILTLHNNPWKCDCSARELLDLIQQKFKEIPHLSNVTCSNGNEPLSKMSVSDLCPASVVVIVSCIIAAVFGLLIGALAALYYRYQREVKVWLYSRRLCLWFVTEEELDRDKLYDAFVSYSHKDENFVVNTLVPELESGENPFKLCLHYRDWIAGEWIPNQIARSVENSRRTLVVLSPNFLESVWSRMEFRAAHKQALSEGRARVIVLLYGDVGPTEDLDPELRAYISMNTYVKWGDPWFWEKLKYALPHPPSLVNTNLNFMRRRSLRKKIHLDDKLELIHTMDRASSPPGGVTPPLDDTPSRNSVPNKQLV